MNENIKADKIRLIGKDGKNIGIFSTSEALKYAKKDNYDLVEIQPHSFPVVCQVMDFYKFLYTQKKKKKENKKKFVVKEIQIRPNIEKLDYNIKLKNIVKILKKNKQVKISVRGRPKDKINNDFINDLFKKIPQDIKSIDSVDFTYKNIINKQTYLILIPNTNNQKLSV